MARARAVDQADHICRLAGLGRGDPIVWVEGKYFLVHWTKAAVAIGRLRSLGYGVTNGETFYRRGRAGVRTRLTAFAVTLPEHTPERRARAAAQIWVGLARARAAGKRLGRPRVDEERITQIRMLLAQGVPMRAIAAAVHVGLGTVARVQGNTRE